MATPLKILVVSTSERLQGAISDLLSGQAGRWQSARARTTAEVIDRCRNEPVDLVVFSWPPLRAEIAQWRRLGDMGARLVVLTNYISSSDLVRSFLAGTSAYLLAEPGRGRDLLAALTKVSRGESLMPAELVSRLSLAAAGESFDVMSDGDRLLLRMIVEAKRDSQIASALATTADDVRDRISSLADKLT